MPASYCHDGREVNFASLIGSPNIPVPPDPPVGASFFLASAVADGLQASFTGIFADVTKIHSFQGGEAQVFAVHIRNRGV